MPLQPISYLVPQSNPFAQLSSDLGDVVKINEIKKQREQAELQKRQALAKELEYKKDFQETIKNPNPEAIASLSLKYPEKEKAVKFAFEQLGEDQKKNEIKQAGAVYSALMTGNGETAKNIIDSQIEARKNSGKDTNNLEMIREFVDKNPKMAASFVGSSLVPLMGSENFKAVFGDFAKTEYAQKKQDAELKKTMMDIGFKQSQIKKIEKETEKLGYEAKQAVIDLERIEQGALDPSKKFDKEEKLRKEYATRTDNFSEATRNYDNIEISAEDNSGAGDVALITSFMKMLDPGSVVRETEFATAQNTSGLYDQLKNSLQKAETGKFLTPSQRSTFKNLAKKYLNAATKNEKKVRDDMTVIVDNYRLNADNVFGLGEPEEDEAVVPAIKSPAPPLAGKPPLTEFGF